LFGSSSDSTEPTVLVDPHLDFESDSDSRISISAKSLQRPHTTVILFEQVVEGTSFEIEIIRRIEGIPSEKGQVFEERVA
jgi:hypothetical protein